MRNEIIRKNTIIIATGLILFFIVSLFVTSSVSRKAIESQLLNVSNLINTQIYETTTEEQLNKVVDSVTTGQHWLRITITNSDGVVIRDSENDSIGTTDIVYQLTKDELEKANQEVAKNRLYLRDSVIYFITKINDDILVRTAVEYKTNTELILVNLFYLLLLLTGVIIVSVFQTRKISTNIIDTFNSICSHLKTINDGVYKEIDDNHKYPEVSLVLQEINEINNNTALSVLKIKNEHDKTNFVIDNMQQGILIVNSNNDVVLINDFAKSALKISDDQSETNYEKVINNDLLNKQIKKSLVNKGTYYFDLEIKETEKIYAATVSYLRRRWTDVKHKEELILVTLIDVTEQRQNDLVKAEFISNASHELKTPITSIRGFSELLMVNQDDYDEKTNKYINIIYNEAVKMKETIDDLLYLSHLQNDHEDPSTLESIDFAELIDEIISDDTELANTHSVKLIKDCAYGIEIYEQPKLLKHLIGNLVENAIRYNRPNGFVKISVREEADKIVLSVIDNGIGMEEKNFSKIFDRFYRVDASHNKNDGGTGLGLNIVKQICAIINAKITVESELNKGTTFSVAFNKNE